MVVPHPDAVTMIASRPPFSISLVHTSMFARACASAWCFASHVVNQGPAASLAGRQHHLNSLTRQQPDGGVIDRRREHRLRASLQQDDAALARNFGCERPGALSRTAGETRRRQRQQSRQGERRRPQPHPRPGWLCGAVVIEAQKAPRCAPAARPPQERRGTGPDRAARPPARRGSAGPATAARRFLRCGPAHDRRDACSARPTGRSSCRQGTRGSGRCAW